MPPIVGAEAGDERLVPKIYCTGAAGAIEPLKHCEWILPMRRPLPAAIFIWLTAFLDTLAFGIVLPVLPRLVTAMTAGQMTRASWWIGVFGTTFAAAQFLFAPAQGALSDRFGRRPVILVSNLGMAVNFVFCALAPSLGWLVAARVVVGMTASSFATANAYVADTTPEDSRMSGFAIIGSAYGLGFIFGPAVGGVLGEVALRLPFWVAACLALANFGYGCLILPESLPKEKRSSSIVFRDTNPAGALVLLRRHSTLFELSTAMLLLGLADCVLLTVLVLYADDRFGWNMRTMGLVFTAMGICEIVVRVVVARRMAGRLPERVIMCIGLGCGICAYLIMGVADNGVVFLSAVPLLALASLAVPPIQTIMTRHVNPDEQGRLQAANASLSGFASIFGPYLFAIVFSYSIRPGQDKFSHGAAFLTAAAIVAAGACLAIRATRVETRSPQAT